MAGLLVRPQLANLNRLASREVAESDLLNNEDSLVPERKFRIRQLVQALSDHEEFHADMRKGAERFMHLYPFLKWGALVAGIVVPVITTTALVLTESEKVVILTLWLFWLVAIITFLVVIEYIRARVQRKADIDSMTDDELYEHLSEKSIGSLSQQIGDGEAQGGSHA